MDADGDALAYRVVSPPTQGSLSGSGALRTYSPAPGYLGPDSFTFTANDAIDDSNTATVTINVVLPSLLSLAVSPADQTIIASEALEYRATGTFSNGAVRDVSDEVAWSSSSPAVADITPTGLATGGEVGTTTITAAQGPVTAGTTLTVTGAVLRSIVIDPLDPLVLVGDGQPFTATGVLSDGTSQDLNGQVNWSSSDEAIATVEVDGVATARAEGSATITATKDDVSSSTTLTARATVVDDAPPVPVISSPATNAVVTGPTDIVGTATDPNFLKYVLEFAPAGETAFTTIEVGTTPVANGVLGRFDPTVLLNDLYTLRLTVHDEGGNASSASVTYQVARDQKVGSFSLAFQDLNIPLSGIPITVNRVYDSRNKRSGDFGFGWSLDVQTLRVRANRVQGTSWRVNRSGGFFPTYTLVPTDEHKVSVTLPDGRVDEFDLTPTPSSSVLFPLVFGLTAGYTARPGAQGTLRPLGNTELSIFDGQPGPVTLLDSSTLEAYEPDTFEYTSPSGSVIVINKSAGVQSVRDASGNTLTFGPGGITHSSGAGVAFTRDAQGRIVAIVDPAGRQHRYTYDANGDLATYQDPQASTTRFSYNLSHGLIDIRNPQGQRAMRSEFDDDGRLIAVIDSSGRRTEYTRDLDARQEIVRDRLGNVTVVGYDTAGNLTSETDPLGSTTVSTYDAVGNRLSRRDPLGQTTVFTYDGRRDQTSETDPLGNVKTSTYDARRNLTSSTDALGRTTSIEYDAANNATKATQPDGSTKTYTYDASGTLSTETDPIGGVTRHEYDAAGRELRRTSPGGQVTTYEYDASGQKTRETDPDGNAKTYTLDGAGSITSVTDALGDLTTNVYDPLRRRTRQVDPLGAARATSYDEVGNVQTESDPSGGVTRFAHDAEGRLSRRVDPDGRAGEYEYDAAGRKVREIVDGAVVEQRTYDAAGRMVALTDPLGAMTRYEHDGAGRLVRTTLPDGSIETFGHDAAGNVLAHTTGLGTTLRTYDAMDRMSAETGPDGLVARLAYDTLGRLTRRTAPDGTTIDYAYDANGQLEQVTDGAGGVARFTRDGSRRLLSFVDPVGQTTSYSYDRRGFLLSREVAGTAVERFTNDAMGRVTERRTADDEVTRYRYDPAGRMVATEFPDGTATTYGYTAAGRRSTITDARGTTTYTYDGSGRPTRVAAPEGAVSYGYDGSGGVASITSPSGTTSYQRDGAGRIAAVRDPDGGRYEITRNALGLPTSVEYPNGVQQRTTYDPNGRPVTRTVVAPSGAVLASFATTRDANGRVVASDEAGTAGGDVRRSYDYDSASRLIRASVTRAGLAEDDQQLTLDAFGNRTGLDDDGTSTPTTYDALGQIVTAGARSFSYDLQGRLASVDSPTGRTTFGWNADNRLREAKVADQPLVSYTYDAEGNRVSRSQGAATTRFVIDRASSLPDVLADTDASGAVLASYVYADGDLLSMRRSGTTSYVHADQAGSTRLLTDGAGQQTDSFEYDAFGTPTVRSGTTDMPYRYVGQRFDEGTGLYYMRARYYDPSTGRFLSPDPAAGDPTRPLTLNRYLYADGDPVNSFDPTGRFAMALSMGFSFSLSGVLAGLTVPIFLGILGVLAVALLITGVLPLDLAPTITRSPAAVARLEVEWAKLTAKIAALTAAAVCGLPLFHYTGLDGIIGIVAEGGLIATPTFRSPGFTHPAGAYATVIPPVGPTTRSTLQDLYKGGDRNWDVSQFVMMCSNLNPRFFPSGYPSEWYAPAPAGSIVPVEIALFGPNLMLP